MQSSSKYFFPKILIFIFYFLPFFTYLIASQWAATSQFTNQHSSQFSPQQQLLLQQQQSLLNNRPFQYQRHQIRPSFYDPVLKVKSHIGYLPASASTGTFVRIGTSDQSLPLQILVEDKDLQPGTPSAVYQYVLSGYGAERFAVDHQGNLYLADATNHGVLETSESDKTENTPFVLHVIAKEMDTEPKRNSLPISIIIQLIDNNKEQMKQRNYYSEEIHPLEEEVKQSIYIANVSALAIGERAIAQIKAREEGDGNVIYRIIDVSDGAFSSFRYDEISNELRAVGPLLPGHKYKVVIEARDSDALVGHAVVLVQALPSFPTNSQLANNNQLVSSQLINQQANLNKIPTSEELLASLNSLSQGRQIPVEGQQQSLPSQKHSNLEQFISVDLSELTPIGTFVTALGGGTTFNNQLEQQERQSSKYFRLIGDGDEGKFILEPENGILFTGANLDREKDKIHRLRIETRSRIPVDHLLYVTNVKVNVLDANDNAPHFVDPQPLIVRTRLDELSPFSFPQTTNLLLGRLNVADADEGENARISLKVLPPLDRLFIVNDEGEIRINGPLTAAHLGEHHLTLMAIDHGQQPLEARAVVSVRIDGRVGSNVHETLINGGERGEITSKPLNLLLPFTTSESPKIFSQTNNNNKKHLPSPQISSSSISSQSSSATDNENINSRHLSNSKQISDESAALERNYERQLFGVLSRVGMAKEKKIEETTTKPLQYTNNSPLSSFSIPPQLSSSNQTISKYPSTTTTNSLSTNYLNSTTTLSSIVLPVSSSSQLIYTSTDSPQLQIGDKKEESTRLAPIFASAALKIFVEENEEQLELATLSANYPDEGPGPINYVLLAGDQSLFSINASNGVITLLKALDAESTSIPSQPPIYHLKVGTIEAVELQYLENGQKINLVTDTGLAHFCDIQINVVDINDWIPNFEQNLYEFTIPATAEPGTIIGQVHAFDQDITSPNNKLFYYIIPKKNNSSINSINAEQFFSLNSQTGQLKTLSNLKNFAGRILKFRIQVVDGGVDGNKLNSTAEIAVHLEGA
uniref:Cadherin domain-containing protein n=1 Tax=Meloidogyne floridensis TaxID=298350 RepID=A0A915NUW4_9BILA